MEKLKYAFNKIKNGFIMFFCIIWISMIASFMAVSRAEGGAEVNGFLCFIFWIICVFLAVKKTPSSYNKCDKHSSDAWNPGL